MNFFLPAQIAGTEWYAISLIHALQQKGINSIVVIPNHGEATEDTYEAAGIPIIKYAEPSVIDRSLIMGKRVAEGLASFVKVLKKENPSVVHFHELIGSNGLSVNHVKAAHDNGFKTVMTFHLAAYSCKTGSLMYKSRQLCDGVIRPVRCTDCVLSSENITSLQHKTIYTIAKLFFKMGFDTTSWNNRVGTAAGYPFIIQKIKRDLWLLAESCSMLVVYANWYKEVLLANGIKKDKIKYIAPALKESRPIEKNRESGSGITRLVFVGRINAFKGIELMIEAVKSLPPGKVLFDIYGHINDDEYTSQCLKLAASNADVTFKGPLSSHLVVDTLSQYDVFCLASIFSEMSPLVIQEAFAAGIPVLASEVYGNAELIADGVNGWLFKFKDVHDLRNKLMMLIENPGLIEKAKKNIPAVRSFNEVADEYEQLYKSILTASEKKII